MMYREYSVQALRWESLGSAPSFSKASTTTGGDKSASSLRDAQNKLCQALQEQQWLLEENQSLEVPPTHLDECDGRVFSIGDFVKRADAARHADIQRCSLDENGARRLLTTEQFQQLKQTGELIVPSGLFENQCHTWKVAPSFYTGRQNVAHSFGQGCGAALDHYVVYSSDAIIRKEESCCHPTLHNAIVNGFVKAGKMLWEAMGQLFSGRLKHRTYSDVYIDEILQDAECLYIYSHLLAQKDDTRLLLDGCYLSRHERNLESIETVDCEFASQLNCPTLQNIQTAKEARQQLDSMRNVFEVKMESKRQVQFCPDNAKALEGPQAAMIDFERAHVEWQEKKEKAWLDHLRNTVDEKAKEVSRLEVDRLLAIDVEKEVDREDTEAIEEELKDYEANLKTKHPILHLSPAWRKRKVDAKHASLEASVERNRLERIANRLEAQGHEMQCAIRKLGVQFRNEVRGPLAEKLRRKMSSFPPATFEILQLNPNHWTFQGGNVPNRYKTVQVDLGKRFWRIRYSWMMAVTCTKHLIGGAFHFLISGPLSLRALFSSRPFYSVERPVRDETSFTPTLVSRLKSFYATLRAVRQRFDAAPDTGLIGKSIQSFFLGVYLSLKRTIGSVFIVTFMTCGTALATVLSLTVLVLAPVLAIIMATATTLFNLLIFDTATATACRRASCGDEDMPSSVSPLVKVLIVIPYTIIFPGVIQAALSVVRFVLVHPIAGTLVFSWATVRYVARSLRDSFTWLFIHRYSRVPASDTFLAWRIHGPGLSSTQYYRLPVEAAKGGVLLVLDKYRLRAHGEVRRNELNAPYDRYSEMIRLFLQPLEVSSSLQVQSPSSLASQITTEIYSRRMGSLARQVPFTAPRIAEHSLDVWDTVAEGIRAPHPDFREAQEQYISNKREASIVIPKPLSDTEIVACVDSECSRQQQSLRKTALGEMVFRAGKLLADWNLKMDERDRRLNSAISVPPSARGKFRMSAEEQQELWEFTLSAVELYGQQLKLEMDEVLLTSKFSEQIRDTVARATDSYYTSSVARPGRDIPVVAAFLLQQLLGGFNMLDTLESTDKSLVLSPKMSKEDEHLVFWSSVSKSVSSSQPWVWFAP